MPTMNITVDQKETHSFEYAVGLSTEESIALRCVVETKGGVLFVKNNPDNGGSNDEIEVSTVESNKVATVKFNGLETEALGYGYDSRYKLFKYNFTTKQYDLILEGEITVNPPTPAEGEARITPFDVGKVNQNYEDLGALYNGKRLQNPIILTEDGVLAYQKPDLSGFENINLLAINDGTVTYLKLTSKLKSWLKSNGYASDDDLLIPHNLLSNNYAVVDKNGNAHQMVEIPRKNWDVSNQFAGSTIDPAFMVNGVQKRVLLGKFQAGIDGASLVTQANKAVKTGLTFDQELTAASGLNNGTDITGFHLMTNAEWALVQKICKANNYVPAGNNSYGRDADNKSVTGRLEDPTLFAGSSGNARWYAGSGGTLTAHNLQESGIYDLNGNIWERVSGFRLNNGEIQIIPNNNAAVYTLDQSSTSSEWKAILADGTLVAPGTANSLKMNGASPISIVEAITNQLVDPNSVSHTFETVTTALSGAGINLLKSLGIIPFTTGLGGDYIYARNYGERIPLRGGDWAHAADAGLFALHLNVDRGVAHTDIGFRFAFIA